MMNIDEMHYADYESLPMDDYYPADSGFNAGIRSCDIPTSSGMNVMLLCAWAVICMIGFAVIFWAKMPIVGVAIIAIPTFMGMVLKPTFALSLALLALPTGAGISFEGVFTLDKGIGIALALSFLLNIMVTRPRFRINDKAMWFIMAYSIWIIIISPLLAADIILELTKAFSQFQLLIYTFIVYWILQSNGKYCLRWVLRCYVIGTLGMTGIAIKTGAQMRAVSEIDRYAATVGAAVDANFLAVIISLAFLSAIYLFAKDKNLFFRLIYFTAFLVLPVMVFKTGSRGALIAIVFTLLSPLLFVRQVLRKPSLAVFLLLCILIATFAVDLVISRGAVEERTVGRVTDVHYARESVSYRMSLIRTAIRTVVRNPMGTSSSGWFQRSGAWSWPHNDFFYVLGLYGIPGALFFALFLLSLVLTVKRMPMGIEKLFGRAILTFLLITGLSIGQTYTKHFWVFLIIVIALAQIAHQNESEEQSHQFGRTDRL
ncbi:MAG: O-antigen ligase family protein [Pseudomonadota bacterium]